MYKIVEVNHLSEKNWLMKVEAPFVTRNCQPGQFLIVRVCENGERIPLTIYDYDKEKGLLHLIYQVVGASTMELSRVTDEIFSVAGPLGNPNEICKNPEEFKDRKIVYVAGGVGIAPVYPQVKYLSEHGFKVDVIYGARSANLFMIRDKIEKVANKVMYATDDGSFGKKGFVTDLLKENIDKYDLCVAIGPVIMMKNVANVTKEFNLQTIVSMNPIMVDGSGMCGACRCEVEGKPKFACIHGPEFDAHKVNFDLLMKRMSVYKEEEKVKLEQMEKALGENM